MLDVKTGGRTLQYQRRRRRRRRRRIIFTVGHTQFDNNQFTYPVPCLDPDAVYRSGLAIDTRGLR
jgi:hypothetical protein